jgi:hypothetical protein
MASPTAARANGGEAQSSWTLAHVFLLALSIRWIYDIVMYAALGNDGLMSGDAYGYMRHAEVMAQSLLAGKLHGWDWLGEDISVMPIFPWLLALNALAAGAFAPLTGAMTLGLIDAGTCVIVGRIGHAISPRYRLAAGLAAAINPTQIVLSGLLYTDTPFTFFVALSLLGAVQWIHAPTWRAALITALGIGLAAMARIVIMPWTPVLVVFLIAAAAIRGRLAPHHALQLGAAAAVVLVCISPILARNVDRYGAWALTAQSGVHLARFVVPLVKEGHDGTPWEQTSQKMAEEIRLKFPEIENNPFASSDQIAKFGRDKLLELGPAAIAKSWISGAIINIASPAVLLAPPVSLLPRTGFYDTKGANAFEKMINFLFRSSSPLYAWILLAGAAGVAVVRLLQLAGFAVLLFRRDTWPDTCAVAMLFALWVGFILAISGPIASPKYRLPIEPVLAVLTGVGFCCLRDGFRRRLGRG